MDFHVRDTVCGKQFEILEGTTHRVALVVSIIIKFDLNTPNMHKPNYLNDSRLTGYGWEGSITFKDIVR